MDEDSIKAKLSETPAFLSIDFDSILLLQGEGGAANGDNNDPIVASGKGEIELRKLIAEYGFERMPMTYGELHGLLDYCSLLDSCAGNMHAPHLRAEWQTSSLKVYTRYNPQHAEAFVAYCEGDKEKLRKLHRDHDTLTKLGKDYREPEN